MEVAASYSPSPVSRLSMARSLTLENAADRLYSSYDENLRAGRTGKGRKERFYDLLYIKSKTLHDRRGISRASVEHHPLPERVDGGGATPTIPISYVQSVTTAMHSSFEPQVKRGKRGRLFAALPGPVRSADSPTNSSTTPTAASTASTCGPGRAEEMVLSALSPGALSSGGSGAAGDWLGAACDAVGGGAVGKGWTTENTTDRTSLSSSDWGDDVCEFDRQESRRVRLMFEQIEAMLFEEASAGPNHLYRECRHWVGRFPHLRLLGLQLVPPQDHGFSYHPMPLATSAAAAAASPPDLASPRQPFGLGSAATPDNDTMSLLGKRLEPNTPPSSSRQPQRWSGPDSAGDDDEEEEDEIGEAEEEVFAMDGIYEDVIAVDHRITEEDMTEKKYMKRRRHHGYPPLTPNAVLKDSIVNAVFDTQWAEIVSWMRPLLAENIQRVQGQHKDVDILPVLPLTPNQLQPYPSARQDGPARDMSFGRFSRPSPATTPGLDETTLASLLQISIKTLQTRERSSLQDIPESPSVGMARIMPPPPAAQHEPAPARRPNSSAPRHRPGSVRQGESSTRVPSARARGRGRLAPLDRSRTPFQEESLLQSGLRGRSLQPGAGPDQFVRSGTLPPLSMSSMASHQPAPASRSQGLGRIGSAAVGGDKHQVSNTNNNNNAGSGSRVMPPSAAHLLSQVSYPVPIADNRPSTTHTFRSDTPFGRRSSTPLGLRAGVLLNLDIRGSGIGNSGMAQHAHLEEAEEASQGRPAHASNWGSYPPPSHSVNNPYRRAKQLGYIVR